MWRLPRIRFSMPTKAVNEWIIAAAVGPIIPIVIWLFARSVTWIPELPIASDAITLANQSSSADALIATLQFMASIQVACIAGITIFLNARPNVKFIEAFLYAASIVIGILSIYCFYRFGIDLAIQLSESNIRIEALSDRISRQGRYMVWSLSLSFTVVVVLFYRDKC